MATLKEKQAIRQVKRLSDDLNQQKAMVAALAGRVRTLEGQNAALRDAKPSARFRAAKRA